MVSRSKMHSSNAGAKRKILVHMKKTLVNKITASIYILNKLLKLLKLLFTMIPTRKHNCVELIQHGCLCDIQRLEVAAPQQGSDLHTAGLVLTSLRGL